jgi:zona occludens toxin (predicted ATPase)
MGRIGWSRRKGRERGAAAVEYSILSSALLGAAVLAAPGAVPLLSRMLGVLDGYYRSVYFVLALPLP